LRGQEDIQQRAATMQAQFNRRLHQRKTNNMAAPAKNINVTVGLTSGNARSQPLKDNIIIQSWHQWLKTQVVKISHYAPSDHMPSSSAVLYEHSIMLIDTGIA